MAKFYTFLRQFMLIAALFIGSQSAWAQTVIWSEDFSGQNGKGATGSTDSGAVLDMDGVTNWSIDVTACNLSATSDWFRVEDADVGQEFSARDLDGEAVWMSAVADISGYTNVTAQIDVRSVESGMEDADYIKTYYILDGGAEVLIAEHSNEVPATTDQVGGLSGSTLQIVVRALDNGGTEYFYFDNAKITGILEGAVNAPSNLAIPFITSNKMSVSWTRPAGTFGVDWHGVVVFLRESDAVNATVTGSDGIDYTGNTVFGSGTQSGDSYCVANFTSDSEGSITVTGLTEGVTYHLAAYTYKTIAGDNDDDEWSAVSNLTSDEAEVQGVTNFSAESGDATASLTWINPASTQSVWWDEVMILASENNEVSTTPTGDGSAYTPSSDWSNPGTEVGTGNFVVYKGTGENVNLTNLTNNTTYYFRIYVRYASSWTDNDQYQDATTMPLGAQPLFFSEIADAKDNFAARFVELFNAGTTTIDFDNETWYAGRQTNGVSWDLVQLAGKVLPGETFIIANDNADFQAQYGFLPDMESGSIDGNGDDSYGLFFNGDNTTGVLVDIYGVEGVDGTGEDWEYKDRRATRNATVTHSNSTWDIAEWTITTSDTNADEMRPATHNNFTSWIGATADWATATNWANMEVPTATIDAAILPSAASAPVITGAAVVNALTIRTGATLTVNPTHSLSMNGKTTNNGQLIIKADATGHAQVLDNMYDDNQTGTATVECYVTPDVWHLAAVPVSTASPVPVYNFNSTYVRKYATNTSAWGAYLTSGVLLPTYGIDIYHFTNPTTISFTGRLQDNNMAAALSSSGDSWNLMGNPYTTAIDWTSAGIDKSQTTGTVYLWDGTLNSGTGGYRSHNGTVGTPAGTTEFIPSCQGFFVKAVAGAGNLGIAKTARAINAQNFYKGNSLPENLLRISVVSGKFNDEAVIYSAVGASTDYDLHFDSDKLLNNQSDKSMDIYTLAENATKLSINVLDTDIDGISLPFEVKANFAGEFKIAITESKNLQNGVNVYLENLANGEMVNLSETGYTFTKKDAATGKFMLHFKSEMQEMDGSLKIHAFDHTIYVRTNVAEPQGTVLVYDISGKEISRTEITATLTELSLEAVQGVYFVKVISPTATISEKVYLK